MRSSVTDAEFIELFRTKGPSQLAKITNGDYRHVFRRRKRLEKELGITIEGPRAPLPKRPEQKQYPHRATLDVPNGVVIIASDAHYWPGPPSLMHRALVSTIKELKPKAVILNGDVIDAPTISRHARIGWEHQPTLIDEIEAAKERLWEIEKVTGRAQKIWNLGNHDARFESRLANVAPEYAKIKGTSLQDHFSLWAPAWATWINETVVVKHRWKGGIHAPYNNTLNAGKTMVTGHLHSARVTPFTDYNGTRYGVDTGCIAETDHQAFVDYTEDSPKNWRSAFGVFTFKDSLLMLPELVTKWDDETVQFRGWVGKP